MRKLQFKEIFEQL